MTVILNADDYLVEIAPEQGASLLRAEWRGHPVLVAPDGLPPMKSGCFVMAPFCNRIAGGRFRFGGEWQLPINSSDEGVAAHGFARDAVWQVAASDSRSVRLTLEMDTVPWRFAIDQTVTLGAEGVVVALAITNTGTAPLPFGIGLHPWFPKPAGTRFWFNAGESHHRDGQRLPRPVRDPALPADGIPPFMDACFTDWDGHARLEWPDVTLDLRADGAFRYLHVYTPTHRDIICAEPVSHLPNAVNRPDLPPMDILPPGGTLRGAMRLKCMPGGRGHATDERAHA